MIRHVEGSFEVTSWSEEPAGGLTDTLKVTTAAIGQRFNGGIEADTVSDTVMTYNDDGTAEFVAYQRVVGRVGDKSGNFVLRGFGTYDGNEARTELEVIPGSAHGELAGLTGRGVAVAPHGSTGSFHFDLEL
jgi:Protein of unknown function (DUF3224)